MAKIPDFTDLGQRPAPQPASGVVGYQTADEGAIQAQAGQIGRMGSELMAGADQMGTFFNAKVKEERQRFDQTRAEDAWNQLRNTQLDLTYGDKGFTKIKGGEAVNGPMLEDYGQKFEQTVNDLVSKLGNDDQKRLFMARANVSGVQMKEDLLRHAAAQNAEYQTETYNGTLAVAEKFAANKWNEPGSLNATLLDIKNAVTQRGKALGWAPEYTEAMLKQEQSKVNAAVINQAIANKDYVYAQKWFDEHKDEVDAQTSKVLGAAVYEATQKQVYNGYTSAFLTVRDSAQGLKQLEDAVSKDGTLDEQRKNAILGRIATRQDVLQKHADALAARADAEMTRRVNLLVARVGQGWEPSAEDMGGLINMARQVPAAAPLIGQLIETANATRAFRTADPMNQQTMLTQAELGVRNGSVEPKLLSTMRTIYDAQNTARKADPVTFAVRQGVVAPDDIAAKPIDVSNPAKVTPNQLQARIDTAAALAQRYRVPTKILTEEEQKLAVATLATLRPSDKAKYFSDLYLATGSNAQGYKAIMAQIAPDDPVTAMAGIAAKRNLKDTAGQQASTLMLEGQEILHPPRKSDGTPDKGTLLPMPAEKDMRARFDNYVRDSLTDSAMARSSYYQASLAIYAGLSRQAGDKDTSILNTDRWEKAMDMAVGGTTKYNGRRTVKPWGMPDGDFKDGLDARLQAIAATGKLEPSMTLSKLRDMPLRAVGDGRYVLGAGDAVLADAQGKPVVIDFNQIPAANFKSGVVTDVKKLEAETRVRVKAARTVQPAVPQ